MKAKKLARIGLVGAGFMGRCHANAFRCVGGIFDLPVEPVRTLLADVNQESADRNATQLGFGRATADWRALCADPEVDIVAVAAPNALHEPIVMAALAAGKDVYCEKPLSTTGESARRMTQAAEKIGAVTSVGFNYLRNPLYKLAREILRSGELGETVSFRGRHAEGFMGDPELPHSFRTEPAGGGALADIGSHIISVARYLVGPISEVSAHCEAIHKTRPISLGSAERAPVVVDDVTHAIVKFANGATGNIEANWAAVGRTMDLSWEVTGTKGSIVFTQERMNELLIYAPGAKPGRGGFTRIEAGPAHPPYGAFCPAPGHHLGFNDLKVIEVAELLTAWAERGRCESDFREAYEIQKTIEAMQLSSRARRWTPIDPLA